MRRSTSLRRRLHGWHRFPARLVHAVALNCAEGPYLRETHLILEQVPGTDFHWNIIRKTVDKKNIALGNTGALPGGILNCL